MKEQKFNVLKQFYSSFGVKTAITDLKFTVLWSSDEYLIKPDSSIRENLGQIRDFPIKKQIYTTFVNESALVTAVIKPITEGIDVEGYVIEFLERNDVLSMLGSADIYDEVQQTLAIIHETVNNIMMGTSLIEDNITLSETDPLQTLAESKRANCNRLLMILSNVSEYINSFFCSYNNVDINLCALMENLIIECNIMLAKSKRYIDYDIPKTPITVKTNHRRLSIVLMNAIQNALLYSSHKDVVKITLTRGNDGGFYDENPNGFAHIIIENGGDIVPDEAFISFSKSLLRPKGLEKTGLGLEIIRRFAETNGGGFNIYSRPEGGAVLDLKIPVAADETHAIMFDSYYKEYLRDKFSPVKIYLYDVISDK